MHALHLAAAAASLALLACSSTPKPTTTPDPDPKPMTGSAAPDHRTKIEQRRDAGCDAIGPKLTQCAVDDARRDFEAGKVSKADFDKNTSPDIQHALTRDWDKKCKGQAMSTRQVRVLEVCFKEETECAPLLDCLKNLQPPAANK